MRIGDRAERTGVSTRLLRYDEEQGLGTPARPGMSGRTDAEADAPVVRRSALLIRAGVPTRLIRAHPDLERADLDTRAGRRTRSRETIRGLLAVTQHAALVHGGGTGQPDRSLVAVPGRAGRAAAR